VSGASHKLQLEFLSYIQRLLDEGGFVATYKYALLMALADLSVEIGDNSGAALPLTTKKIAAKFVRYYWPQARPYAAKGGNTTARLLLQNTGSQAAIVNRVRDAQAKSSGGSYDALDATIKNRLINRVRNIVEEMPLWRLQKIGNESVDFLYENAGRGSEINLRPGIAFCFRRFHGLVRNLAENAWVRFIRERPRNRDLLGDALELQTFLFGHARASLDKYVDILRELQSGKCFYCYGKLRDREVDHFIPWSRYPIDLAHNFVLACSPCNNNKRDILAFVPHLENWVRRNDDYGANLAGYLAPEYMSQDPAEALQIARWAYGQAENAGANVWVRKKTVVPLGSEWHCLLA